MTNQIYVTKFNPTIGHLDINTDADPELFEDEWSMETNVRTHIKFPIISLRIYMFFVTRDLYAGDAIIFNASLTNEFHLKKFIEVSMSDLKQLIIDSYNESRIVY